MGDNGERRRKRECANRKWTPEEESMVCEKLRETVVSGGRIEHPTARVYYEKLIVDLALQDVNHVKLKAKVANLKTSYLRMIDWRSQTGQGVLETSGPDSVKAYILGKCPMFDLLEEIFGGKVNVNPPITIESGMDVTKGEGEETGARADDFVFDDEAGTTETTVVAQKEAGSDGTVTFGESVAKKAKRKSTDGMSALSVVQKERVELMKQKMEAENNWRSQQIEIEHQKCSIESQKLDQAMEMKRMELEHNERLEKYRIDQEMKTRLEIAKMQFDK